jgi:UDPglucose 6-dehydrogenase
MARLMVVGAGVVGQATGKGLIKKGHNIVFVDKDNTVIRSLEKQGYNAVFPHEISKIKADISMICVPTPTKEDGRTDLSYITSAVMNHARWMETNKRNSSYHVIVIRSTVPPTTTQEVLLPLLETYSGMKAGKDFGLCMQPEFLRNASSEQDFANPRIIVIGEFDKRSGDILENIYKAFSSQIVRIDINTAEFMKYVHNCFNATKISFSNEMWRLGQKLGIDANLALQLASSSAEGYWNPKYGIRGGAPYGGACLPKDVKSFLTFAMNINVDMPLLSAVLRVNENIDSVEKIQPVATPNISRLRRKGEHYMTRAQEEENITEI